MEGTNDKKAKKESKKKQKPLNEDAEVGGATKKKATKKNKRDGGGAEKPQNGTKEEMVSTKKTKDGEVMTAKCIVVKLWLVVQASNEYGVDTVKATRKTDGTVELLMFHSGNRSEVTPLPKDNFTLFQSPNEPNLCFWIGDNKKFATSFKMCFLLKFPNKKVATKFASFVNGVDNTDADASINIGNEEPCSSSQALAMDHLGNVHCPTGDLIEF